MMPSARMPPWPNERLMPSLRRSASEREAQFMPADIDPSTFAEVESQFSDTLRTNASLRETMMREAYGVLRKSSSSGQLRAPPVEFIAKSSREASMLRNAYDGAENLAMMLARDQAEARAKAAAERRKQLKAAYSEAVYFAIISSAHRAFRHWASFAADLAHETLTRVTSHLVNRELARGWLTWHAAWSEAEARNDSLRHIMKHMLNRQLSMGWKSWMEMARERQAALDQLRNSAGHLMNRKLSLGWRAWRDTHASVAREQQAIGAALGCFLNRELSRSWRQWQSTWSGTVLKLDAMRQSMNHMLNRELSRGWCAWVEMAIERAVFVQRLRKGVGFLVNRKLALGFATWHDSTATPLQGYSHGDTPVARAMRYVFNRNLVRGWLTWHAHWSESMHKRVAMTRSLTRMLNRQLSRGWGAWEDMVIERADVFHRLRKAVGFMVNRKLAMAFATWFDPVNDPRRAEIAKALGYLTNHSMSRGWVTWQSNWAASKRKRESMRRSLGHMVHRGMSMAWSAWVEMAVERDIFLQKLRKGVGFMVNRNLAVGFATWRECPFDKSNLARALSHFLNSSLARSMLTWLLASMELRRQSDKMRHSLQHMLNRSLSMGWQSWTAMVRERHEALDQLRKSAGHMTNRKLSLGWRAWRAAHELSLSLAVSRQAMTRAVSFLIHRGLARGWNALWGMWREAVKMREDGRRRRILHKEMVRAQRAAAHRYRLGPTSEFLAKNIQEAKRVRLIQDRSADRLMRTFGPRPPPPLRPSSSDAHIRAPPRVAPLASSSKPVLVQGRLRPQSARGLKKSASAQQLPMWSTPWEPSRPGPDQLGSSLDGRSMGRGSLQT